MPQFDPAFFAPQLFWLAVTFVTLYMLMSKVALPKIGAVLDERQRKIDDNLDKAAQLKADAEAAVAAYERALAESRAHAHTVIKEASDRLAHEADERTRAISQRLADQVKEGEAKVAAAKDKAVAGIREIAADLAAAVVGRLVGATADGGKLEAAVGAAFKEQGK